MGRGKRPFLFFSPPFKKEASFPPSPEEMSLLGDPGFEEEVW